MKSIVFKSVGAAILLAGTIYITSPLLDTYVDNRVQAYLDRYPDKVYASTSKGIDLLKAAEQSAKTRFVHSLKRALEQDTLDPVLGNPKAQTTVVMFSDYNCGYCKKAHPTLQVLLDADDDLRVVIKEFPILGPMSHLAAMASIVVHQLKPEQYHLFQEKMFATRLTSQNDIVAIAETIGISSTVLLQEIPKLRYSKKLNENLKLAEKLQISSTPAFVINGKIYLGALSTQDLQALVSQTRQVNARDES